MFVVFDLDGTLANTDHRAHLVAAKDWRGYFAACDLDPPHSHVMAVAYALIDAGHEVEIWSGRSDEVRDKTEAWLAQYGLGDLPLKMRQAGDHTADEKLKLSWLLEAPKKPDMIFDDRAKVVRMWRENGVPCAQVADGDF